MRSGTGLLGVVSIILILTRLHFGLNPSETGPQVTTATLIGGVANLLMACAIFFIANTNTKLLPMEKNFDEAEAARLVTHWGQRHHIHALLANASLSFMSLFFHHCPIDSRVRINPQEILYQGIRN